MKFLCEQCKAKYQIADEKAVGKTVRMKCRKCGHLIEVRAAVTETSVSSALPGGERPSQTSAPSPARALPPRARPVGAAAPSSLAQKPAGALEGAFKSAVQHEPSAPLAPRRGLAPQSQEEETSTPFDMADLSPSEEWYVAINGVPVGPIRVAEVRRKAALGAVSEESLVWQEGLDEWRPLRLFPELAASVREAMSRLSRPPAAEVRVSSIPPPPPARSNARPPAGATPGSRLPPPRSLPSPLPRSNVVPIMSRLATAERLEPAVAERSSPVPPQARPPSVAPDPFAPASVPAALAVAAPTPAPPVVSRAPMFSVPSGMRKSPPWMAIAMVAAAVAFGVTGGIAYFVRPDAPQAPVVWPNGAPSAPSAAPAAAAPTAAPATDPVEAPTVVAAAAPTGRSAPARAAAAAPAPTQPSAGRSLDLHSLAQSAPTVAPSDDNSNDSPRAGGGTGVTESQIQQVMALHRTALSRMCWERNPSAKAVVNVNVMLTIAGDGSAQNVTASGDEPSVAKCIENDIRGWRFPAMGGSQKTSIPFKFVRQ